MVLSLDIAVPGVRYGLGVGAGCQYDELMAGYGELFVDMERFFMAPPPPPPVAPFRLPGCSTHAPPEHNISFYLCCDHSSDGDIALAPTATTRTAYLTLSVEQLTHAGATHLRYGVDGDVRQSLSRVTNGNGNISLGVRPDVTVVVPARRMGGWSGW